MHAACGRRSFALQGPGPINTVGHSLQGQPMCGFTERESGEYANIRCVWFGEDEDLAHPLAAADFSKVGERALEP